MIAVAGEALKKEGEHTLTICYDRLQEFSLSTDNGFKKQLLNMTQQAYERKLQISASGFFYVDHSLIMFISINTCTYMIFVFQFMTAASSTNFKVLLASYAANATVH